MLTVSDGMKEYKHYQSDIKAKPNGIIRRLLKGLVQLSVLALLLLFFMLIIFRWVPIPTSAFIYHQNKLAQQSPETYEKAAYQWLDWEDISPQLAIAVIAAEDQRFPNHWGVDTIELRKALSEKRSAKGNPRGASTLTQQLAKNLFLWNGRSYTRKVVEAGLALAIEISWPKERILEVYLNVAQFGDAIFGANEASRQLFDKPAKDLTKEEAALLAAVLPRPAISNVNDPSPALQKRQQWILKQMKQLGGTHYLRNL